MFNRNKRKNQNSLINGNVAPTAPALVGKLGALGLGETLDSPELTIDERLQGIADAWSTAPGSAKEFIPTKTHRGPRPVYLFEDKGSPHNIDFIFQRGANVMLFRQQVEEVNGRREQGIRRYVINTQEANQPRVTSEFVSRRESPGICIVPGENEYVKEIWQDKGPETAQSVPHLKWLEESSGLLTDAQHTEMSMVGYALSTVEAATSRTQ